MPFNDFDVFWSAAGAVLQARDPYALPGVYYPLPFFFIFLPLAALPLWLAHLVWTAIELLVLVAILRWRAPAVLMFAPVFLALLMGQIIIPMLGLFALLRSGKAGGIALALMALKPQLVVFLAPWLLWRWWKSERRQIVWLIVTLAAMALAAFIVQPDWMAQWLSVSGERIRAPISPSVWGLLSFLPTPLWIASASLVTAGLFIWAWRRNNLDVLATMSLLINPILISYDLTLLTVMIRETRVWMALTVLSWVAFSVSAWQLNESSYVIVTVLVIWRLLQQTQPERARSKVAKRL